MKHLIDDITLDNDQRLLSSGEVTRSLEPKVFELLTTLLNAEGKVVSRELLLQEVWKNRVVGEGAINRTVSLLRSHFAAFTDDEIIETIPKLGYKFLKPVKQISVDQNRLSKEANNLFSSSYIKAALATLSGILLLVFFSSLILDKVPKQLDLVGSPLINLSGLEYNISASSNGELVLFHHINGDNEQSVVLYNAKEQKQTKLFNDAIAALSPNAKHIAYIKNDNERDVYSYDIESKKSQLLMQLGHPPQYMKWGADNYLYFNARASKSHPYQVFRFHINTGHTQQVTNPQSSNNTRGDFQFAVNPLTNELAVLRYLDGGKTNLITYRDFEIRFSAVIDKGFKAIAWHPNNRDLVVTDRTSVYQYQTDTKELHQIKQLHSPINSISVVERNEKQVLLLSDSVVKSNIQEFDVNTRENVTWQQSGGTEQLPRLVKDRQVFFSNRHEQQKWWQVTANKTELINATIPFDLKFTRYELSADGSKIVLSKKGAIYEVSIDSRIVTKLLDEKTQAYVVNYNHQNNNSIIYSSNQSGQWQLWLFNRDSKSHQQLTTNGGYSGQIWNNYLYYSKYASDGLWRKNISTGEESLVITDFTRINWLNWNIINNHLYYFKPASGIWLYDLTSSSSTLIMEINQNFVHQYTVSPNLTKILWVQRTSIEGDIYQLYFEQ